MLRDAGLIALDEQAQALGVNRSTAWTILNATQHLSGLSAKIVNRMLMHPQLPPLVRDKVQEYINEKLAGNYGHNPVQCARYLRRLMQTNGKAK